MKPVTYRTCLKCLKKKEVKEFFNKDMYDNDYCKKCGFGVYPGGTEARDAKYIELGILLNGIRTRFHYGNPPKTRKMGRYATSKKEVKSTTRECRIKAIGEDFSLKRFKTK